MPQCSSTHFSTSYFLLRPIARIVRATVLGVGIGLACGGTAVAQVAPSESASIQKSYKIPAGTLAQSLNRFASEAGITLSFTPNLVEGKQAQELKGNFTPQAGLQKLLQGSGLETVIKSDGSFSLKLAVPVAQLKTVKVTAAADLSTSYRTEVASITRGAESLKEVPQSVTVITSKLIEDQNLTMMSDAMAKAPGIVATTDGLGNPEFRSRGFLIENYQIDNMGTSYTSTFRPDFDLAIYDRVEVLRGADGLFSAAGEPGGTINLARKRPTDELRSSVSLAYGSWDNLRTEADIGGAIALDGRLRGRVVGVWQDREFFYSPADEEKQVVYGILEYDLTPSTKISGGASEQHVDGISWISGLPTYNDGRQLGVPRDVAFTVDWTKRDTTIRETFLTVDHQFNEDWSAKLSAMKQRYDFDYLQLSLNSVNPATGLFGEPGAFSEDDGNHSEGVDLTVNGRFRAWGLEHKLVAGIDSRSSDGKQMRNNLEIAFPDGELGVDDFPGLDLPEPSVLGYSSGWPAFGSEQEGAYAKLDLQTTDRMHIILGGRYGNYKHRDIYQIYDSEGNVTERDTSFHWRDSDIFTPYGALTYELTPDWTTYASFTEVYKPQGRYAGPPENPTKLDPITGSNYELGAKGIVLNGLLNISTALYRIERNDEAIQDTRYGENSGFWLPLGRIVSEGLDMEVSGELAPGWEVFAGYTYNRNENEMDDVIYSALTPKHTFKLWTDYILPGAFSKWGISGGVTAKSKHANLGTYWVMTDAGWTQPPFEIKQGGYAVWDARVNYQMSDSWNLSLNLNNIFDENYYATLGRPSDGNWYGTPRNATVTLRGQF